MSFSPVGNIRRLTIADQGVPDYTGVQQHTSAQALPIALMWGTRRLTPNIIWQATIRDTTNVGGLVGDTAFSSGSQANLDGPDVAGAAAGYTNGLGFALGHGAYQGRLSITTGALAGTNYGVGFVGSTDCHWHVPMLFALCEGPVNLISRVWNGGGSAAYQWAFAQYAPSLSPPSPFYELFLGSTSQTAWGYFAAVNALTGGPFYPGADLAYRGTAYIASAVVDCGHTLTPPQQSFDVARVQDIAYQATDSYFMGVDYSLAAIIPDLLTSLQYGMGLQSSDIDSVTLLTFKQYQFAQQLYFSPLLTSQSSVVSIIDRWAVLANTWIFWSGTSIMFAPLGDEAITANGQTYTPDATPAYNLGLSDFLVPLSVQRADPIDCHNRVVIEISDRRSDYAKNPIEWKDTSLISQFGIRDASNVSADDICDSAVGARVVELLGKRLAYIRNLYSFTVSARYIRILPGTIVTLTDPNLGLSLLPVRVRSIDEDEQGALAIVAEEYPGTLGISRPMPVQTWSQTAGSSGGTSPSGVGLGGGSGPMPTPGVPISGPITTGSTDVLKLIQAVAGGYTITLGAIVPGVIYRWVHVGGAAGTNLFETVGQGVILSRGSNTFTIEDPQDRLAALGNTVTFLTSQVIYEYILDSTNNVFRCLRQVR